MGLTLSELGKLASVSTASVAQAERREVEGQVTLTTLKKMADAMECDLIYAFVPKKDIKTLIHDKGKTYIESYQVRSSSTKSSSFC